MPWRIIALLSVSVSFQDQWVDSRVYDCHKLMAICSHLGEDGEREREVGQPVRDLGQFSLLFPKTRRALQIPGPDILKRGLWSRIIARLHKKKKNQLQIIIKNRTPRSIQSSGNSDVGGAHLFSRHLHNSFVYLIFFL